MLDVAVVGMGLEGGTPHLRSPDEPAALPPIPRSPPNEFEGLGGVVHNSEAKIIWGKAIKAQDGGWSKYIEKSNPDWKGLGPTSKTFDQRGEISGDAVSDKTLYSETFSYINYPQRIYSALKGYIDQAADYEPRLTTDIEPSQIKRKMLLLAVPEYTSPTQWRFQYRAIRYGRERGVSVVITRISE